MISTISTAILAAAFPLSSAYWWGDGSLESATNTQQSGYRWSHTETVSTVTVTTQTNVTAVDVCGAFWLEWQLAENCSERTRPVMEQFNQRTSHLTNWFELGPVLCITNMTYGELVWGPPDCKKEHVDRSPQVEVTYSQSNLVAYLVWRNQTNVQYLESICVKTNTRTWHFDKVKVYCVQSNSAPTEPKPRRSGNYMWEAVPAENH